MTQPPKILGRPRKDAQPPRPAGPTTKCDRCGLPPAAAVYPDANGNAGRGPALCHGCLHLRIRTSPLGALLLP